MSSLHEGSISPAQLRSISRRLGAFILLAGLSCAACIWEFQTGDDQNARSDSGFLSPQDSAKYERQLEIYYGKFGVLTDRWTRDFAQLRHGKPLAALVATLSIAGAAVCFWVAAVLKRSLQRVEGRGTAPP